MPPMPPRANDAEAAVSHQLRGLLNSEASSPMTPYASMLICLLGLYMPICLRGLLSNPYMPRMPKRIVDVRGLKWRLMIMTC
jgi:hypothetical protein